MSNIDTLEMDPRGADTSELMPWRRGHGYGHASFSALGSSNRSSSHGRGHRRSASSGSWATSGVGRAPAALLLAPPVPTKPQLLNSKSEGSAAASASSSVSGIASSSWSTSLAATRQTAIKDAVAKEAVPASSRIAAATSGSRASAGRGRRPSGFMDSAVHPMAAPFRFPAAPGVMMSRRMSADDLSPLSRSSSLSKKLPAFSFPAVSVTRPEDSTPVLASAPAASFPWPSTYSDAIGTSSKTMTAPATGTSVKHPATPGQRDAIADNEASSGCPGSQFQRSKDVPGQQSSGQQPGLTGTGAGAKDGAIGWSGRDRRSCGGARDGGGHGGFSGCEHAWAAAVTTKVTAEAPPLQGAQVPAWRSPWGSSRQQQLQQQRRLVSFASCSAILASPSPPAASSSTALPPLTSSPPPLATTTPTCRRSASTADLAKLHTPSSSISSNVSAVSCATSASAASSVFSGHHHPQQHFRSVSAPRTRRRSSRPSLSMPEYRHGRAASLSISSSNGRGANAAGGLARSPPNTAHVPCKFFRQGACQAGNACPFSHDLTLSADTVCKYFAKGNCKFGPKCANIHVLPDGRRVNYGKNGFTIIQSAANGPGDHASPTTGGFPSGPQSALTSSLYNEQAFGEGGHHAGPGGDNGNLDAGYSLPSSTYGSPHEGFAFSPGAGKGLSILDVPLPASFDSNGMSNAARFPSAPWPSSMPSKFGLDSPAASLANAKDSRTSDTLKLLHSSAFGGPNDFLGPVIGSPPSSQMAGGDEYYGKRAMHSSRYSKPKMMSASVPKGVDLDWDAGFDFGEDDDIPENYVPENLQDLLTPAEKARRGSMRGENDVGADILTKYGSPLGNSPSRWGPLFQRQKEEEELSKSARNVSAFGHVGSPLRNSTLAMNKGSLAGSIGSNRPSMRLGDDSMSALSQQLQDSGLDETGSSASHLHPASARGPAPIGKERHTSTGSVSSPRTARFAATIDEEDPDFVFSMEEDEPAAKNRKRVSSGIAMASYAGVASGKSQSDAKDAKTAPS